MTGGSDGTAGEDSRVEALLRVNAELAAEIRGLQEGRIDHPRSAAAPSARRLGRLLVSHDELLTDHDELIAERDRLLAELSRLKGELEEQGRRLLAETARAAKLEDERVRLVQKIDEYGRLAEALQAEVARLRGGIVGKLRRGVARATSGRRPSP